MPHRSNLHRLLFTPLLSMAAIAQQPLTTHPPNTQVQDTQVHLDVVVTSKDGTHIGGLQQSDFTILDNGAPQPITSFHEVSKETPVAVTIVIDAVNIPFSIVSYVHQELDKFLTANGGKLAQPTTLAILTDKGVEAQDAATRDGNLLAHGLDAQTVALREIGTATGFYGAEERLDISIKGLSSLIARDQTRPGRKLLIFISPGWPSLSGPRIDLSDKERRAIFAEVIQLSTQLRQSRTTLYCVNPLGTAQDVASENYYLDFVKGVAKPGQTFEADLSLQVLATQTGGLVLQSSNDTSGLIQRAVDDASPAYALTFAPPPADRPDEYHSIKIKLAQPNQIARTRQGYYAQPTPTP